MTVTDPGNPSFRSQPATAETNVSDSWYVRRGKRGLDIAISVVAMLIVVPIVLVGVAVVAVSLGRPIFFRQDRMGKHGRRFSIVKLRTMADGGAIIDLRGASATIDLRGRTTRPTRFLRRASIDELPQIWNVLRGDMSWIGPRPEVWAKGMAAGLGGHPRHDVRPGLTGAWQIDPAREGEISEGLHLDLDYVRAVSVRRDVSILLRTPAAVIRSNTD